MNHDGSVWHFKNCLLQELEDAAPIRPSFASRCQVTDGLCKGDCRWHEPESSLSSQKLETFADLASCDSWCQLTIPAGYVFCSDRLFSSVRACCRVTLDSDVNRDGSSLRVWRQFWCDGNHTSLHLSVNSGLHIANNQHPKTIPLLISATLPCGFGDLCGSPCCIYSFRHLFVQEWQSSIQFRVKEL